MDDHTANYHDHPAHAVEDAPVYICEWCNDREGHYLLDHYGDWNWTCDQCAPLPVAELPEEGNAVRGIANGVIALPVCLLGFWLIGQSVIWAFRAGAWLSLQAIDFVDNVGRSLGW